MDGKGVLRYGYRLAKKAFGKYGVEEHFPFSVMRRFVFERLKSDRAVVGDHEMVLDERDSLKLSVNGVYEEFETGFLKRQVKSGDVVVDLGANIGYYTLLFAKWVGAKGKVYAFEPEPENFEILKKNVELNGYKNVVLENKAVGERSGKAKLYLSEENSGDHRTFGDGARRVVEVDQVALDDYFGRHKGKIDLIKMDIQGAEYGAVKGMGGLLRRNKGMKIVSEFWPEGLVGFGVGLGEYLELLEGCGFKLWELDRRVRRKKVMRKESFLQRYGADSGMHTDLWCERK